MKGVHPMSDRAPLWQAVHDYPTDPVRKLVLADWYDDFNSPDMAYALRWAAGCKLHPDVTKARQWATWLCGSTRREDKTATLPAVVFRCLHHAHTVPVKRHQQRRRYESMAFAFLALAEALAYLRFVVDLKPVKAK